MLVIRAYGKHSSGSAIPDRSSASMMWTPLPTPGHLRKYCSENRSPVMSLMVSNEPKPRHTFDSAEMGAIAHLYRDELYRSPIWRTRLHNTTNWAIVMMGIALPTTSSPPQPSPLPLLLVR